MTERYVQRLDEVAVSIERATERTPDASRYHVFMGDELRQSFRSLKPAQKLFRELATAAGWAPERRPIDPAEMVKREGEAADRAAYEEYWGKATSFRNSPPRRRQR